MNFNSILFVSYSVYGVGCLAELYEKCKLLTVFAAAWKQLLKLFFCSLEEVELSLIRQVATKFLLLCMSKGTFELWSSIISISHICFVQTFKTYINIRAVHATSLIYHHVAYLLMSWEWHSTLFCFLHVLETCHREEDISLESESVSH